MKKLLLTAAVVLTIVSCENLNTDLPRTDTGIYISGNTVTFPRGTKAIDIYNTVASIYPDNGYHDVTGGEWKSIKTSTNDGLTTQTWETVSFSKIRNDHTTQAPEINTHTVYLYTSDSSIREIVFEWQRQTTNVWKNDAIDGDITFTIIP